MLFINHMMHTAASVHRMKNKQLGKLAKFSTNCARNMKFRSYGNEDDGEHSDFSILEISKIFLMHNAFFFVTNI